MRIDKESVFAEETDFPVGPDYYQKGLLNNNFFYLRNIFKINNQIFYTSSGRSESSLWSGMAFPFSGVGEYVIEIINGDQRRYIRDLPSDLNQLILTDSFDKYLETEDNNIRLGLNKGLDPYTGKRKDTDKDFVFDILRPFFESFGFTLPAPNQMQYLVNLCDYLIEENKVTLNNLTTQGIELQKEKNTFVQDLSKRTSYPSLTFNMITDYYTQTESGNIYSSEVESLYTNYRDLFENEKAYYNSLIARTKSLDNDSFLLKIDNRRDFDENVFKMLYRFKSLEELYISAYYGLGLWESKIFNSFFIKLRGSLIKRFGLSQDLQALIDRLSKLSLYPTPGKGMFFEERYFSQRGYYATDIGLVNLNGVEKYLPILYTLPDLHKFLVT